MAKIRTFFQQNFVLRIKTLLQENLFSCKFEIKKTIQRWTVPVGAIFIIIVLISPFFLPTNNFQQAKEKLLRNSRDSQSQITLAKEFLINNQLEETEKILFLTQNQINQANNQVLGKQTVQELGELWQKKLYSDPKEIRKLILVWEEIIMEKPNYRDAYLQLAYLHYKLFENEKAKKYLQKAIELDPNYEPVRKLEKILNN